MYLSEGFKEWKNLIKNTLILTYCDKISSKGFEYLSQGFREWKNINANYVDCVYIHTISDEGFNSLG